MSNALTQIRSAMQSVGIACTETEISDVALTGELNAGKSLLAAYAAMHGQDVVIDMATLRAEISHPFFTRPPKGLLPLIIFLA